MLSNMLATRKPSRQMYGRIFLVVENIIDIVMIQEVRQNNPLEITLRFLSNQSVVIMSCVEVDTDYAININKILHRYLNSSDDEKRRLYLFWLKCFIRNYLDGPTDAEITENVRWMKLSNVASQNDLVVEYSFFEQFSTFCLKFVLLSC